MLLWFLIFSLSVVIFAAAGFLWWQVDAGKRRQRMLKSIAANVHPEISVVSTRVMIEKPAGRAGLAGLFRLRAAGKDTPANGTHGKVWHAMLTVASAAAGFLIGMKMTGIIGPAGPPLAAVMVGALPSLYKGNHRNKRLAAMEEQFPEALDFLARSVRAGNAFSVGMELLAAEASEPLKAEFLKVTREMALGAALEDALHGLIARVPLFEIRFFVAAVLLQRETGGNLSEVLGKLSVAVRERLRLRGQVQASSGQGRLTARVLTCLPVATMVMLKCLSPSYMDAMTDDPLGRNLLAAAVVSQIVGYLVMQQIIKIEI